MGRRASESGSDPNRPGDRKVPKVSLRSRSPSRCVILAGLVLVSCARTRPPQPDDALIAAYDRNRAAFTRLAAEAYASPPDCGKDPSICEPKRSKAMVN